MQLIVAKIALAGPDWCARLFYFVPQVPFAAQGYGAFFTLSILDKHYRWVNTLIDSHPSTLQFDLFL